MKLFVSFIAAQLLLLSLQETWYWQGNSDAAEVVLSGVRCKGTELSILQCQHHGPVHCPSGGGRFAAGVTCTSSEWKWTSLSMMGASSPGYTAIWEGGR